MQSRTYYLTRIAPIAVAFSLALIGPAVAQDSTLADGAPQLIVTSPLDAVAGSLPMSLFATEAQQPVMDPAEPIGESSVTREAQTESVSSAEPVSSEKASADSVSEEAQASIYSPSHLLIAPEQKSVTAANTTSETSVVAPVERATDKIPIASAATDIKSTSTDTTSSAAPASTDSTVASTDSPATSTDATVASADSTVASTDSTVTDLSPLTIEDPTSHVQLRGETQASDSASDTTTDNAAPLGPNDIAQTVPTDTVGSSGDTRDFDLTPVSLPRRTPTFNRMEGFKSNILYGLPGRLFFSAIVDNSLRVETNVFQTKSHYKPDMIYRVLPNTSIGWALTRSTRISANYFFLRDQYTKYAKTLDRNFHSVGFQIDQDLYNKDRTSVTLGFFGRALFTSPDQFSDQFFNDLIPSLTVTRQVGYSTVLYGAVLGQIRFREMVSQFQEGDQFYSFGGVHRKGKWTFLGDFTLNSNFGNSNLRQGHNNQVIIMTEEAAYRLPLFKLPIDAYVRCQQIYNMGANSSPGYAGVNTRAFGGIRAYISKPVVMPVRLAEK